jgi:hypothetical protein
LGKRQPQKTTFLLQYEDAAKVSQVDKSRFFFKLKRDMKRESQLALLSAQVESAKSRAERAREAGRDASAIQKIVGSLRLTLAAQIAGLPPVKAGPQAYLLAAGRVRERSVVLGERPVPVSGPYFKALLSEVGLEFAPGQVILVEAEIVRDLVQGDPGKGCSRTGDGGEGKSRA